MIDDTFLRLISGFSDRDKLRFIRKKPIFGERRKSLVFEKASIDDYKHGYIFVRMLIE